MPKLRSCGYIEEAENDPLCRLLINSFLAELHYFPYFIAGDFPEKVSIERHLNALLGLDDARDKGIIRNWTLRWARTTNTRYPLLPLHIRFFLQKGERMESKVPLPLLKEIRRVRKAGVFLPPIL